jgi:DNA helicase HerA-like ATPase
MILDLGIPLVPSEGLCFLDSEDLFKHTYILGKTGSGKSTFMANLAVKVASLGWAVIVIEPKGSLTDEIRKRVDRKRVMDFSFDKPFTINPLRKTGYHLNDIISEFIEVMDVLVTLTAANIESTVLMREILSEAIPILREEHKDLDYLYRFLYDETVRYKHFGDNRPPYWANFDNRDPRNKYLVNREKIESAKRIASRLALLVNDPRMKRIVCGKNELNIRDIAREGKILLADTSKCSYDKRIYLSTLIVHYIKSYVEFERLKQPLIVFVDEFQTCFSPLFSHLLAVSREYKVGFVLAHQDFKQIPDKIISSVLGNVATSVVFNCGYQEASRMADEFGLKANDFLNLGKYEALIKLKTPHKILSFPLTKAENRANYLRDCWFPA